MSESVRPSQSDINSEFRDLLVEFETWIMDLEYAHADLAIRTAKAIANIGGWNDDDITTFLRSHVAEMRKQRRVLEGDQDTRFLMLMDQVTAKLAMPVRP